MRGNFLTTFAIMNFAMSWFTAALPAAGPTFLMANGTQPMKRFGAWVSVQGKYLLVGAHNTQNINGEDGTAFLYDIGTGKLLAQLDPPKMGANQGFAHAGAVSATQIFIGAPQADNKLGKVYVYDLLKKGPPREIAGTVEEQQFGYSIAVDGSDVLIGAPGGKKASAAYLYNNKLELKYKLEPSGDDVQEVSFGKSVAISPEYLLVGANTLNARVGGAFLYARVDGKLLHELISEKYVSGNMAGTSVGIARERLIVGAPLSVDDCICHVFDAKSGKPVGEVSGPNSLGEEIAVCGDVAAVGGEGYVTLVDLNSVTVLGRLIAMDTIMGEGVRVQHNGMPIRSNYFGCGLAADGKNLYVGARDFGSQAGTVVVFPDWAPQKLLKARVIAPATPVKPETKAPPVAKTEPKEKIVQKWTDATGKFQVEAVYESYLGKGVIRLKKKDGTQVDIPIDKLNPTSQEAAKNASAAERAKLGE